MYSVLHIAPYIHITLDTCICIINTDNSYPCTHRANAFLILRYIPAMYYKPSFFGFIKWNEMKYSFIWLCTWAIYKGRPHMICLLWKCKLQIYMLDCCLLWIRGFEFCVRVDATMPFWLCCIGFCEYDTWAITMCNDICLNDVRSIKCELVFLSLLT